MNSLISIIVPVYNVEKYLNECIDSIIAQTYSNIEIILVNDGSTDASGKICDEYEKKDSRIKVIHQDNAGLSAARNAGMAVATGEYLYFVDSDDYVDEKLCEKCIERFDNCNAEVIVFGFDYVDEDGNKIKDYLPCPDQLSSKEMLCKLLSGNMYDYAWNKMYKRYTFDGVVWPVGYVWEDVATIYKVIMKIDTVAILSEALYFYRQRKNSITATMSDKALQDIFNAKITRYDNVKAFDEDIVKGATYHISIAAIALYDRSLWSDVNAELLQRAKDFLKDNREELEHCEDKRFKLYYRKPKMYKALRFLKHMLGNIKRKLDSKK